MPEIILRDATPADAPALLEIYRPFITDTAVTFELETPALADFAERIRLSREKWAWLVAEVAGAPEGTLAGYAYATAHRPRGAYQWSVETSVYLAPAHRGRGIATILYSRLLPQLAELGYCNAYAGITAPNDASVALHRAMGFEPIGVFRRVGWKFGQWHDVSWWQRRLREAPLGAEPSP